MPLFWSSTASKAVASLRSRGNGPMRHHQRHLYTSTKNSNRILRLSSISAVEAPLVRNFTGDYVSNASRALLNPFHEQKRQFLGCGDGEEGGVLSKVYEEKRVLGYSPEQLFDVVGAVDLYHGFVPWCQRSEVLRTYPDGSFDAELEIGFKFLVESYVSHVELERPKRIKTTVSNSTLFDHLINIWEFSPGPVPGSCNLYFLVDFKFQSPLYRQVASVFFKEVVSKLVGSFNDRCRLIYGPGVQVHENSYGQRGKYGNMEPLEEGVLDDDPLVDDDDDIGVEEFTNPPTPKRKDPENSRNGMSKKKMKKLDALYRDEDDIEDLTLGRDSIANNIDDCNDINVGVSGDLTLGRDSIANNIDDCNYINVGVSGYDDED